MDFGSPFLRTAARRVSLTPPVHRPEGSALQQGGAGGWVLLAISAATYFDTLGGKGLNFVFPEFSQTVGSDGLLLWWELMYS